MNASRECAGDPVQSAKLADVGSGNKIRPNARSSPETSGSGQTHAGRRADVWSNADFRVAKPGQGA